MQGVGSEWPINEEAADEVSAARVDPARMAIKLEDLAERHGMMPVRVPRNSCSAAAENLLRKLGRSPKGSSRGRQSGRSAR